MKTLETKIVLSLTLSLLFFAACSQSEAPVGRSFGVNDIGGDQQALNISFSSSEIWQKSNAKACDRLFDLEAERSHKRSRFAFLVEPFRYSVEDDGKVTAVGSINMSRSPLMQFVLTTPAVQDQAREIMEMTDDQFLARIKERLEVEKCQAMDEATRTDNCWDQLSDWDGALGKYHEGILYQEKPNAVMRVLRERFAGLFGDVDEMKLGEEGSVFLSLLERVGLFSGSHRGVEGVHNTLDPRDAEFILTTEVPLYSYESTWEAWQNDIEASIPAAVNGIQNSDDPAERLCALVLWQRSFAQLLMQKGYHGPKLNRDGTMPILKALELSRNTPAATPDNISETNTAEPSNGASGDFDLFPKVNVYGSMLSQKSGRAMILEPSDIQSYDPAPVDADMWQVNHVTPMLRDRRDRTVASLSDQLSRLEGLTMIFANTSPAAPWTKEIDYFLGDLVKDKNAIIPFQTHTLTLGLILMSIRNIGKLNIVPVDSLTDAAIDEGNGTGMVFLNNGKENLDRGEMKLQDLMRFTRAIVRLDRALEDLYALQAEDKTALETRSKEKVGDSEEFTPFYSEEKLTDLLTLRDLLNRLKFPLAKRMVRMMEHPEGCIAEQRADHRVNGNESREILRRCTAEEIAEYSETMRIMAHATRSTVYWRKHINTKQ